MSEDLKARVSYLRGFTEGLDLGDESKEQKVLQRVIDLLEDMTDEIEQLRVDYEELFEYTEAIDEDLTEMEEDFYDDDGEDDDDDDSEDFDGGFSIECPNCREIVVVDDDILDQETSIEVTCPGCGEVVLVDDEEWEEELDELPEDSEGK
ncbi:MAG: AraC family transcriptional regulator [Dethiobacteria bacterium]|nr:AraC family transcriptional regulator [Dethiobacteria bacterium]